jgi:AraC family transcriptional regulator
MNPVSAANRPPACVSLSHRRNEPGPILLRPIGQHRVIVHASPSTWSACLASGSRHLRRQGDIDLLPAGEAGGFAAESACDTLEVRLAPALLDRVAYEMRPAHPVLFETRHMLRNESVLHLARALDSERRAGAPGGLLYAETVGLALASQLVGIRIHARAVKQGLSRAQLQRLFEFVEIHIDQPLTLAVLSRETGASSAHLRHWFKQATGTTVHRYVLRRRVERARRLLLEGKLSAAAVALAAGFSHQSHMAYWMHRELGYAPRMLRRAQPEAEPL